MSEEKFHHPYGPSTLGSLEVCPCYEGRQSETPHERTTAGARAHGVVESGKDDHRLDDKDAVAAAECIDLVDRRRQIMEEDRNRAFETFFKGRTVNPEMRRECEQFPQIIELKEVYLAVDDLEFEDWGPWTEKDTPPDHDIQWTGKHKVREKVKVKSTTAGWVDRVLINHRRDYAEIFDWKFGYWEVDTAESNPQGISYMLGLFREYPTVREIRVWFKQPHLDLISDHTFMRENIPALYLRIQTIVARAREARSKADFSAARPHVPVCNFCANLGKCSKVLDFACKVGNKFYPLEIPDNITPTLVTDPHQTSLAMRLSQVLAIWAGAFRAQVTDRVLRREADLPEGFTIQSRAEREVVDKSQFKQVALQHLTESEYADISPPPGFGAIEDVIKERAPRGSKKAAVEQFQKQLEDSGAVVKSTPYSFLRAVTQKKSE